ncbi:hemicentin-1 isoform X1 [Drosophila santomea]|uniref:hemicentin-1 isoform X1 n=1 Tax=Drosophila santomea TaxID=129105 RepID=UPI001952FB36|nr:hemicentin-1 isoform X1 [Drosophila santomea]XP_039482903.1 hemicentin-1 isoform X1 [Drosophila santomea]XP_039482910.1 hemicentin-1 isoform X1 [Drosophila santomea]
MAMAGPHCLPRPHTHRRLRPQPEFNVRQLAIAIIATAAVTMLMTATPTLAEIPSKGKHTRLDTQQTAHEDSDFPRFAEPIANVTVSVGRDALMACVVENLKGYKVAWVRVDTQTILSIHHNVISQNSRISLTYNDHRSWYLHIKEVEETDRGWYMCQVNTDPMRSRKGYLQVVVPPMIVEGLTSNDMVVREGQNISLVCKARGYPEPYVMWRREDGEEMLIGGEHVNVVDGELLHITKVSRLHMAAYLCVASNGVPPSISKRVHLRVQFPPMLSIPNQLEGAYLGQDVILECHTEAYPASINYWTTERGDMIISDTSRAGDKYETTSTVSGYTKYMKLKIRAVGPNDFGTYRCVAKNSLGETDGNIKLDEMPTPTTAIISEMSLLNRSYDGKRRHRNKFDSANALPDYGVEEWRDGAQGNHAGNNGDNNQTPVRNPPGAFHNSAGSLAQHNLLAKIMLGIKTQSFGIFKRLSSSSPLAAGQSFLWLSTLSLPSAPSRWRMSNVENRPYSPETIVNSDTAAECWESRSHFVSDSNNNNSRITERPPMWARHSRIFHIAHTPCGASTQYERLCERQWQWQRLWQCQWPMLICIVILAGCFVRWLPILLHFIGRHIGTFSISATHRQHLMCTFWGSRGNKVVAKNTTPARPSTFQMLCSRMFSR